MGRGGHKKHGWERPRHDQEGSIINAKPSKPRNSSRNGERHTQPLCKSRAKSKGNRKAQGHDLGADYRLYNWTPFARESVKKVSLDVDRYKEDLGIALSLSLLESHKAAAALGKKSKAPIVEAVEEFQEYQEFEEDSEDFEGDFEEDDASLPEIVSEDGDDTLARQGTAIEEEIGGEFAPEIDNLCGDLTGVEDVSSDGDGGWSWESFSSASDDREVDEDEEYEFVDEIREDENWSMVPAC